MHAKKTFHRTILTDGTWLVAVLLVVRGVVGATFDGVVLGALLACVNLAAWAWLGTRVLRGIAGEDPMYTELSPDAGRRCVLWREFLLGEEVREGVIRRGDWAIGDDDFRQRLAAVLGRPVPRHRGRPRKLQAVEG